MVEVKNISDMVDTIKSTLKELNEELRSHLNIRDFVCKPDISTLRTVHKALSNERDFSAENAYYRRRHVCTNNTTVTRDTNNVLYLCMLNDTQLYIRGKGLSNISVIKTENGSTLYSTPHFSVQAKYDSEFLLNLSAMVSHGVVEYFCQIVRTDIIDRPSILVVELKKDTPLQRNTFLVNIRRKLDWMAYSISLPELENRVSCNKWTVSAPVINSYDISNSYDDISVVLGFSSNRKWGSPRQLSYIWDKSNMSLPPDLLGKDTAVHIYFKDTSIPPLITQAEYIYETKEEAESAMLARILGECSLYALRERRNNYTTALAVVDSILKLAEKDK